MINNETQMYVQVTVRKFLKWEHLPSYEFANSFIKELTIENKLVKEIREYQGELESKHQEVLNDTT